MLSRKKVGKIRCRDYSERGVKKEDKGTINKAAPVPYRSCVL